MQFDQDVKIKGVSLEILRETFKGAKKARQHIIKEMEKAIDKPRVKLSPYAPRILTIRIDKDKIRKVIGAGGKVINEIIDQTGAKIDIDDDGLINITSTGEDGGEKALQWIKDLTREVKQGETFNGKVVKIMDFGAFIELLPGQDGLLHISEISRERVDRVDDVLKVGQKVFVKVKDVDSTGRVSLTLKNAKDSQGES